MIDEPGAELADVVTRTARCADPFQCGVRAVEAPLRDGAPTLVPIDEGGARIACVLVLAGSVSVAEARVMLYRRRPGVRPGQGMPPWSAGSLSWPVSPDRCLPLHGPETQYSAPAHRREARRPRGAQRSPPVWHAAARRDLLSAAAETPRDRNAADAVLQRSRPGAHGRP